MDGEPHFLDCFFRSSSATGSRQVKKAEEKKIFIILLLTRLRVLASDLLQYETHDLQKIVSHERTFMENNFLRLLLKEIIGSGDYSLEGIAFVTHIPYDVLYDFACGLTKSSLSISSWAKLLQLYLEVKPDVAEHLINQFADIKKSNNVSLSSLLHWRIS